MVVIADRYELGRKIGVGGMGTVYLGKDLRMGESVAIKQLKPELIQQDPAQLQRFIREGELLRQLDHPNIVKMLAFSEQQGDYFIVMEYVNGGSLLDVLQEQPKLSVQRVLYIALDLADALTRAHRLKILHRDIKPANVLIADDGTPRLTDFGMARQDDSEVTQEGMVLGTLAYLSPEALRGETLDERSDIWAFGVMLYEMLAGERPFGKMVNAGELIHAIMTLPIIDLDTHRSDVPTALIDLILRMLTRERQARIPSVRLVGAELESILRGATTSMQTVLSADTETGRFQTDEITPVPGANADVTPTPTPRRVSNLPTQATPFIGREQELEALGKLLGSDKVRLVTLLGPGGIGKTRLALEAAEQYVLHFSDGVFFVPLAAIEQPDHLMQAIAESLNFRFSGADDPAQQLRHYLSDKNLLLILDNFEHLSMAADSLAAILSAAPNVQLLVTSRERLRLQAEQVFEVNSMTVPQVNEPLEALQAYHAVQLFLQSAHRIAPTFALDEQTAPEVARVLELVQGLPLGIELAAAWLESLPISDIAHEIEASLDFLETDLRDVPERHRSIRAVFEYSWNLLTPDERDAFMKLSVFRHGFEREAAHKVTGASLKTLTNLTNKSLIRRDPEGRYAMSKLLKQYAAEQFDKKCGDQEAVHKAHAMYYGELLAHLSDAIGTKRELDAMKVIDLELENIRAAMKLGMAHDMWDKLYWLIHVIALYFRARGLYLEGERWFNEMAETSVNAPSCSKSFYWRARTYQAMMLAGLAAYDEACKMAEDAIAYFESTHEPKYCGIARLVKADVDVMQGDYASASNYAQDVLQIYDITQINFLWINAMQLMAYVAHQRGNYREAKAHYETLVAKLDTMEHSPSDRAAILNGLGEALGQLGEFIEAAKVFTAAYETYKSYKHKRGMASALNNLAGLHYGMGDYEEATRLYEQGYKLNREVGDRVGLGHSLSALGNLAVFDGQLEKGKSYFNQSLNLRQELGDPRTIASTYLDLSRVAIAEGDEASINAYADKAEALFREIGDQEGLGYIAYGRATIALEKEDYDSARTLIDTAARIAEETGSTYLYIQVVGAQGTLALYEERYDDAKGYFVYGIQYAQEYKVFPVLIACLIGMVPIIGIGGDLDTAMTLLTLVERYPKTYMVEATQHLEVVRQELTTRMTPEAIRHAEETSKTWTVDDAVALILKSAATV